MAKNESRLVVLCTAPLALFIILGMFGLPLFHAHCIRQSDNATPPPFVTIVSDKMDRFMANLRDKMSLINYTREALCAGDIDVVPGRSANGTACVYGGWSGWPAL